MDNELPRKTEKPWGYELLFALTPQYAGKILFVKKGHRLQRTVWLTDIVPTICYLMNLPLPEQVEGAVIYQAFENPNLKLKEISTLKSRLASMEASLAQGGKES